MEVQKQGILVISRHAESEWNLLGKWTGWTDVNLTEKGMREAEQLGEIIRDIQFDAAYTSELKRTQQTCDGILRGKGDQADLERIIAKPLNERDYGDLTGKNKWEVKDEIGSEAFQGIRRGWDYPVPGGETLKDVYARAIPYFQSEILPRLQRGENILLVSHGNTIRALMKYLDQIPDEEIGKVEMPFGTLLVYKFDAGHQLPLDKQTRTIDIIPPKAWITKFLYAARVGFWLRHIG